MSKTDMDFLIYWIPTFVAALIILVATLLLGATIPKEKNGKGKGAAG